MASNSEANLPSDFDIDEVINWDEHNYSSKDIGFQLPSLDLPTDVKTPQNPASHPSLPPTVVSSQQPTTLPVTQNASQSFHTLFGTPNNASTIRNSKSHGFPSCPPLVQSPLPPRFPSESLNIPSINVASSSPSLLRFSSGLIQDDALANQIRTQQLRGVQNTGDILSENVTPFADHTIDDNTDLVEGPLDKIVDQIMDREFNKVIMETTTPSNTFSQHSVATFTNVQNRSSSPGVSGLQCVSNSNNIPDPITTAQGSGEHIIQKNTQSHPQSQFVIQTPGSMSSKVVRTLASGLPQNASAHKKAAVSLQNATNIEELFGNSTAAAVTQNQFMNPAPKSASMPTPSLLSSPVNDPKSPNPGMSTSLSGNMNSNIPLVNANVLQNQTKTSSVNSGFNRTQNSVAPKLAFVTSVSYSALNNLVSQGVQSKGLNVKRGGSRLGVPSLPSGRGTMTARPASQPSARDLQVQALLQNLTGTPGIQPNFIESLSKQETTSLPTHLGTSQPKISSPKPTASSVFTLGNASPKIDLFQSTPTSSAVGSLSKQSTSNSSQSLNNPNNLPSHLGTSQAKIASTKPTFMQANVVPRTTGIGQNDNFPTFTLISPSSKIVWSQSSPKQPVSQSSYTVGSNVRSVLKVVSATTASPQSMNTVPTTLKITSPSTNIVGGFKQPNFTGPNQSVTSLHSVINHMPPRLSTTTSQSVTPASPNLNVFSKFQLGGPSQTLGTSAKSSPMVFTLAHGSQGAATLKALGANDKLAGSRIFLLHQPGKVASPETAKVQSMKIVFVNEKSVGKVVCGPQKSSAQPPPTPVVSKQSPVQMVVPSTTFSPIKTDEPPIVSPVPDTSDGSPSSVNSNDSDVIPPAVVKQTETVEKKEVVSVPQKKTGKKRKKDANKPVKPLSSFQRFFQKTQAAIRQQSPNAPFPEVSKIAKQMWERLTAKDKKVYQDAWRSEREQYKKALEEYNASLNAIEVDCTSPKQLKNGQSSTSPISASPVGSPTPDVVIISAPTVPAPSSSSGSPSSGSPSSGSPSHAAGVGPPRGSGKPLAMMVELANKTKMASEQASGKTLGATKSPSSSSKTKASSNGIEDSVPHKKKKLKINPMPKKSCIRENCSEITKMTKERGNSFCSNECVMLHCRGIFSMWVQARRASSQKAS